MAYDIGTARGVIEMQYNGRGVAQAEQDLQGLEKTGNKTSTSMKGVASGTGKAGLVIAAALGAGVAAAANFEQRMSAVQAVSGANAAQMDQLSKKALQLGADTSFSAGEAANAIEELVKSGMSVSDVMNGAADATVALAAAGEIDLPQAATIASNAMNQFNLNAKDMPKIANLIAGAANASAIGVSDLGQSMTQVGAVANLAGVSFEDTATAIALMGNAGIKGSDAGTSLKSMLSRLIPTTVKAKKEMISLGLMTEDGANKFFDAQGKLKSFDKIAGLLSDSTKHLTAEQKQMALQTLFGSDAIRAAAIMANNGAKGFNKMNDAMGKTTAAEVAAKRLDNLKGDIEAMKGSLETLGITLGSILLPTLRKMTDAITQAVNFLTNLSSGWQKTIVGTLAFVAAALLVVSAVLRIIIFVGKVQEALVLLRGTMIATWAAALGPIALVIAAVALVAGALYLLFQKNQTFHDAVIATWNAIKGAVAAVAAWFTGTFVPALQAVWSAVTTGVQTAWAFITGIIRTAVALIKTIVVTYLNALRAVWASTWGMFGPLVKAVWNLIVAIIKLAWTIIKGVTILGVRLVMSAVRAGWNAVKSATSAAWNAIKAVIMSVWRVIGPYVKTAVNAVKSAITTAWNAVKSVTTTVWNAVKTVIDGKVREIEGVVKGVKAKVLAAFDFAGEMVAKGKAIIQGIIDGITAKIGEVTAAVHKITGIIASALPGSPVKAGPLKVLNRGYAGKQIVEMVIGGVESMAGPMAAAMAASMPALAPAGLPAVAATGSVRRKKGGSGPRTTLLMGELDLTGGRAFVSGVAEDVYQGFNDDNARRNGM